MLRVLTALVLATAWPLPGLAQVSQALPGKGQQCLTPALEQREPAQYPELRLQRKEAAFFHLELSFTHPDKAPRTRVVERNERADVRTEDEFLEAAERYASQLRMPCLQAGDAPVTLRQTFQFVPNDGRRVTVSAPTSWVNPALQSVLACLQPQKGNRRWPTYPRRAARNELQGNVIVQVRFDAPDAAPQVEILTEPSNTGEFSRVVREAFANLRAPCATGEPVSGRMLFIFRLQDDRRTVLRDINLRQLAGAMKRYPAPAFFDMNAMGCPFDLRVEYLAPHMRNTIAEVGASVPQRAPFLQWLSEVELDLPADAANLVLGDTFTLQVPCLKLDLQP